MLILGLSRKQNGRPIEYIMLLSIIHVSPQKRRVWRLWRLIYGLLTMAMLLGLLMDVKDPGKVRNRPMAKSRIVLLIINVDKTLILTLPRKQNGHPIGYITLLSIISPLKRGVRHLRRLIYGLLTMAMLVWPLMVVKDPGKVRNQRVAKLRIVLVPILILVKMFISL